MIRGKALWLLGVGFVCLVCGVVVLTTKKVDTIQHADLRPEQFQKLYDDARNNRKGEAAYRIYIYYYWHEKNIPQAREWLRFSAELGSDIGKREWHRVETGELKL